jgi:streptogramin lyase
MHDASFAPSPPAEVRRAVIDEWELGGRASMQHDLAVHPDGRVYSVDMTQDQLYRLDPVSGESQSFALPASDLPLGGVFGGQGQPLPSTANARFGPHSLQIAPDGAVWITLALGNRLARFDPRTESFEIVEIEGYYPHTLRFDLRGRVWYTVAGSNHLGMWDPISGEGRTLRLPSRTLGEAIAMRLVPFAMWLGRYVDVRGAAAEGDGFTAPIPYGIDIAPDGSVWFSQLNDHRIGRVDPDSFDIEMIDTPFTAPRRLRFDGRGRLWIPGFSSGVVASFDPKTGAFHEIPLPIEPFGSETPYALNVHRPTGDVWICGTNSDTLIRLDPDTEAFDVYPLPTRVTYTRDVDFDDQGRVWTSNSNQPAWQIEGGMPRILRLDPDGLGTEEVARREAATRGGACTVTTRGCRGAGGRPPRWRRPSRCWGARRASRWWWSGAARSPSGRTTEGTRAARVGRPCGRSRPTTSPTSSWPGSSTRATSRRAMPRASGRPPSRRRRSSSATRSTSARR